MAKRSAYLITDASFVSRFLISLVAVACIFGVGMQNDACVTMVDAWSNRFMFQLIRGASHLNWGVVLGLLSSSCCAIQLVLGLFSFGCAGFNTWLGPVRPIFMALTVASQTWMWMTTKANGWTGSMLVTGTTLALSFLPEVLQYSVTRSTLHGAASAVGKESEQGTETLPVATVEFKIEGMGCIACVNTISRALNQVTGPLREVVVSSRVDLEAASVYVDLCCPGPAPGGADKLCVQKASVQITELLDGIGFPATVQSQKTPPAMPPSTPQSTTCPTRSGVEAVAVLRHRA